MNQKRFRGLFERQALSGVCRSLRLDLTRQVSDGLLEVGVMPRDGERRAVLPERLRERPAPMEDIRKAADGREVLRRALKDVLEFLLRFIEQLQLDKRTAQRNTRGQVRGMDGQARPADVHGVLEHRRPAVLFRELGERNRRRIPLDPSSQIVEA